MSSAIVELSNGFFENICAFTKSAIFRVSQWCLRWLKFLSVLPEVSGTERQVTISRKFLRLLMADFGPDFQNWHSLHKLTALVHWPFIASDSPTSFCKAHKVKVLDKRRKLKNYLFFEFPNILHQCNGSCSRLYIDRTLLTDCKFASSHFLFPRVCSSFSFREDIN